MSDQSLADAPDLTVPVPQGPVPSAPAREQRPEVELSVDGQRVSVPEGSTLLDACRQCEIDTPTLCYVETLTPVNVCRVCVVEMEGSRTLVPACSRKAEPGMVIRTDSERVRLSRRMVLEFLASSTDVTQSPELCSYMESYGADPERYGERDAQAESKTQPAKVDNELYIRDYAKCVLCYKCVEACGEDAQNTFAIAVAGRGFDAHIATEFDVSLPESACVYCGNCIGVCPTGALVFKAEHDLRERGEWDASRQESTDTICPYCGVGCTLSVHTQDNQIVKVTSPLDQEVTSGNLCIKGRFGWQFTTGAPSAPDDVGADEK
ncbi:MAG: 2Fe-2S iron-sulfur cluster-binding protein [Bryobacterales bacterium]|nr:2Fe-2S iron-sulfur cluster-binding protein [Bryobacterales bacterium]